MRCHFSFILWPHSLDNCLAVNNTTTPPLTKVSQQVRGHNVTPATRGTYGAHMKRTMREWSNSVCGALPLKPKPFSQLFSPSGQNISCMLIFTGQWWPHRAESVLAHSQEPETSLAHVSLGLKDAALDLSKCCHALFHCWTAPATVKRLYNQKQATQLLLITSEHPAKFHWSLIWTISAMKH